MGSASGWNRGGSERDAHLDWRIRALAGATVGLLAAFGGAGRAWAGGGPENALLVVDPTSAQSLLVANHYRSIRGIPEQNVLYMRPAAESYQAFAAFQVPALLGMLENRALGDHIDYIVIPPGGSYFVPTEGLVDAKPCNDMRRMSISSAYSLAYSAEEILGGTLTFMEANRYHATNDNPRAFDSNTLWLYGSPGTGEEARRYFIAAMLGYTGPGGNSLDEIVQMIDRSAAVDGTRPAGTFYFMRTDDDRRSPPRDVYFSSVVDAITRRGGQAQEIHQVDGRTVILPLGHHDVLGVMTGHAAPPIDAADMTLLPGSFADHLTSFAGMFDSGGQTKMSRWIAKGASGTAGTVEEPCAFGAGRPGKFPHPRLQVWYYQGQSLGESMLRSIEWAPFQTLFYGDPLTRPFADFPFVDVPDAPAGPVSGVMTLTPEVAPGEGGRAVRSVDLYIDGVHHGEALPGESLSVDTTLLADGQHDLRVVAYDDSAVRNQGRWVGAFEVANRGRAVTLRAEPLRGDLSTVFDVQVEASGAPVSEIRLLHNERVIAARQTASARFAVPGNLLGAGIVDLRAVAEYADGRAAVSAAAPLAVRDESGGPIARAPTAYGYTAFVRPGQPRLLDLPVLTGALDVRREILADPAQSTLIESAASYLLTPAGDAAGTDHLVFRAAVGEQLTGAVTVTLRYCPPLRLLAPPAEVAVCLGEPAELSVVATGGALAYQWWHDERPVPGATAPRLRLPAVRAEDLGTYEVEVESWCDRRGERVRSDPVRVSRQPAAACRVSIWLPLAVNRFPIAADE